ncbi:efflux RND transporter periplasmic adaptor subunit [Yersinia rochesterensis]|uniref:efflux RND transporter periplasmic adaptor subunit n=1 Tax=Yersinia TaxID=629 RepID=UPI00223FA499|nr:MULTISPECIES: efflux RND transporter periplasmic adaptor subunit [Yersinia]MDA5544394.1 efflux RND transporter periplasmic adaptor subunit [Yersinia rochesterensis]UZM74056.1 efflux RND transporter periplasmic adaptor subunit [Yersinia sp. SCPM-O-B-9106 (C-191)]
MTKISMLSLFWLLSACDSGSETAAQTEEMPAIVNVTTLTAEPVSQEHTFPGRVAAFRIAQIRPQVSGIVTEMKFNQGSELTPGQALFQIDPASFKADVNSAAASLQKAQASYRQLQAKANRLAKIRHTGAVSDQDYEEALSTAEQAKAVISEARATLERRQLDLSYATVKSPISGRVDQNFITEGALVSASDSQALATVQQIDKVYVDVRQPAAQMNALRTAAGTLASGGNAATAAIISADGTPYSNQAQILFTGVSVDASTGDVVMRLLVDNPDRTLLPGMYVQAKITRLLDQDGLMVPREAVVREGDKTYVWLNEQGKAKAVKVELGEAVGANFFIRNGLKAGDRLVIKGMSRLQEGISLQLAQSAHP